MYVVHYELHYSGLQTSFHTGNHDKGGKRGEREKNLYGRNTCWQPISEETFEAQTRSWTSGLDHPWTVIEHCHHICLHVSYWFNQVKLDSNELVDGTPTIKSQKNCKFRGKTNKSKESFFLYCRIKAYCRAHYTVI